MVDETSDPLAATLAHTPATDRDELPAVKLPPPGYDIGELIGRGGMGEVMQAYDQRIGREVALKRMRGAQPTEEEVARFLREARIQARLDHPAIVPVHELGTDAHGQPYFTMKRLAGVTLAQRLHEGGALQPMLRALVDVCLAVELAHTRGIVHRDLKPANIMLGDYGEVYVLDWGVARVIAEDPQAPGVHEIDTLRDGTQTGAMLGTPGYMAPEQIKGVAATPAADVYALGSILFEILAGEALHPRGNPAIATTLASPQQTPGRRRPDRAVPPELDAVCHAALAEEPAQRPTARQLADKIQAYLDGDRDIDQRRRLAGEQLADARAALASGDPAARVLAVRRAGRALALDPESTEAAELVTRLIVEPPAVLPPALRASLDEQEREGARSRSGKAFWGLSTMFVFWLFIPFMEVLSWPWVLTMFVLIGVLAAQMFRISRTGTTNVPLALIVMTALMVAWSRMASPYVLTPVMICGALMALAPNRQLNPRPFLLAAWAVATLALPVMLEWTGVLAPTVHVYPDYIWVHSAMFRASGWIGDVMVLGVNGLLVLIVSMVAVYIHRNAQRAQRQLHIQAWHLRQLIPAMPAAPQAGAQAA